MTTSKQTNHRKKVMNTIEFDGMSRSAQEFKDGSTMEIVSFFYIDHEEAIWVTIVYSKDYPISDGYDGSIEGSLDEWDVIVKTCADRTVSSYGLLEHQDCIAQSIALHAKLEHALCVTNKDMIPREE
jgi:hypothetical protein